MGMQNPQRFANIGLFAKYNNTSIADTFQRLVGFLAKRGHKLYIEEKSNTLLEPHDFAVKPKDTIAEHCDLVLVVGGDGSLLNAARAIVPYQVPILGINRGRLGFLADTKPQDMEQKLSAILDGVYVK